MEKHQLVNQRLVVVHLDTCGPLQHALLSDSKYFVTFIDDFSRKAWVFFMKKKSETFNKFKYFKQVVKAKTNAKIGCLQINKGGEFTLGTFNEFCEQHGIRHQLTQFHTHQNEVTKRKNSLLTERAKNMAFKNWLLLYL
jgi:transposase InsO family protein